MSKTSNADVDQALAAIGSSSLPYRTFTDMAQGADGASRKLGAVFPLLAAVLPEIADQPVHAATPGTEPAPAQAVVEPAPEPAPAHVPDRVPMAPVAPEPMVYAAPTGAAAPTDLFRAMSQSPAPPARTEKTSLAGVFRLLKGPDQASSQDGKCRLDALFRRL